MLQCVINLSEGRRTNLVSAIASEADPWVLDLHLDPDHHRSVITMAGPADPLERAVRRLATRAVAELDLREHAGAHPRMGVLDVVPWIDLDDPTVTTAAAVAVRDRWSAWAGDVLGVPCFRYGPQRSLPDVRRGAFVRFPPDTGPLSAHPTAGAIAVGARSVLVAYNLWLAPDGLAAARGIAREIRGPALRALGLQVGRGVQVSCNLIDPWTIGPAEAYDLVAERAPVVRAELVGLLPLGVFARIPADRHAQLDVDAARTIEARIAAGGIGSAAAGRPGGS